MIKTKEVFSGGFYIFESKVSANSNYIETIQEARQLLIYAKYYLRSYVLIHDYVITRHGWQMAVEIKLKPRNQENDVWKVISERIRLWLSTYVKRINSWRNRKGVLVRDNYRRYYFEDLEEALGHLDRMRNQRIKLYQKNKKYRGIKRHYKIDKEIERGSIFLCSKELEEKGRDVMKEVGRELFREFQKVVGAKMINFTSKSHILKNNHNYKTNSS